jgi:hypothetical protein
MSANGNGNGRGNGNGNGRGPPDHVKERSNGRVHVGKSEREELADRAAESSDQMDRIEAKIDLIITELRHD